VHEILAYLRTTVARVDSSLLEEWENLLHPAPAAPAAAPAPPPPPADLALTPKAFQARVRAELQSVVRALAEGDYEEAVRGVRQDPADPWDAARFADALAPFLAAHGHVRFDPRARRAHHTLLHVLRPRVWRVQQILPDPAGDDDWCLEGEIDLRGELDPEVPLVRLLAIHD
jgi:hypothetical protein